MLNANNERRSKIAEDFDEEMREWLKDKDCWVLEHVYRYFHTLAQRDKDMPLDKRVAVVPAVASPLCVGLNAWWLEEREPFLEHIEKRKQDLRGI
jgi:hypothetical protein